MSTIDWQPLTIEDVTSKVQYGYTTKASTKGSVKFLRTTDITSGALDWDSVPYCETPPENIDKYLLNENDILISRAGSVGYSYLVKKPEPAVFASYLIRFVPKINAQYISYFLQSSEYWSQISEKKLGIAVQNVNATKLKSIEIPVPNSPVEQERIVSKIEELFSEVDESISSLGNELSRCALLKASIIEHAYREASGKSVELKNVTEVITDGDHQAPPKSVSGVPFIVISNIVHNSVDLEKATRYVPESYYNALKDSRKAKSGDVLYTVTGSYGIPALIENNDRFCFQRHIALLRPDKTQLSSKYLLYALQTNIVKKQADKIATGTAQLTVPLTGLRKINIPFVEPSDQEQLVQIIEGRLSEVEALQSTIQASLKQAKNMKQSILSKAFKGELL